ncbi:SAM-dependent methyltransferase [Actinomadura sp. 7K507]|uniref:SAM-dependent methyltransferase n=1 Tax=Actinomadura sp. 7K507 TaxID=2530365 RepID=UPI0010526732|nr:SAM-dependent methyltransferase [Actinomadura sp. 7K507]TDC86073.1 SAM-dependent methyltransferase [Actinomadura sp. 7K507]
MADDHGNGPAEKIDTTVPQSSRIWNYWMGGKDHYEIDREAGDAYAAGYPGIFAQARESRNYLMRVVEFLAGEAGVSQFVDVGTGLPTMQNTHEVAQRINPETRIVYFDNDPVVLAHARALLSNTTPEGVTVYIDSDFHRIDKIIADAQKTLDLSQPVALMFMGVLGHAESWESARSTISGLMNEVPSGSYLAHWDGADTSAAHNQVNAAYNSTGAVPYNLRSPERITALYEGLDVLEPGIVDISQWGPGPAPSPAVDAYGGVARKP